MATPYNICLVTVGDEKTAALITDELLKKRLAACVSAVPGITSVYRWKNKIKRGREILLVIKTKKTLREDVTLAVRRKHPYSVPEILFVDIAAGGNDYLDWLGANTLFFTADVLKDKAEDKRL